MVLVLDSNLLVFFILFSYLQLHTVFKMNQDGRQWYYSTMDIVLMTFHIILLGLIVGLF